LRVRYDLVFIAVHFWAPTFKWGISIANVADFAKPTEKISYPQQVGMFKLSSQILRQHFRQHAVGLPSIYSCVLLTCFVLLHGVQLLLAPESSGHATARLSHR
jgi:hypothetical protein